MSDSWAAFWNEAISQLAALAAEWLLDHPVWLAAPILGLVCLWRYWSKRVEAFSYNRRYRRRPLQKAWQKRTTGGSPVSSG